MNCGDTDRRRKCREAERERGTGRKRRHRANTRRTTVCIQTIRKRDNRHRRKWNNYDIMLIVFRCRMWNKSAHLAAGTQSPAVPGTVYTHTHTLALAVCYFVVVVFLFRAIYGRCTTMRAPYLISTHTQHHRAGQIIEPGEEGKQSSRQGAVFFSTFLGSLSFFVFHVRMCVCVV